MSYNGCFSKDISSFCYIEIIDSNPINKGSSQQFKLRLYHVGLADKHSVLRQKLSRDTPRFSSNVSFRPRYQRARFRIPPLLSPAAFSQALSLNYTSAMSFSTQVAARCARQLSGSVRPSSLRIATSASYLTARRTPSTQRWESTEAAPAAATNPKISQIVDQISTLTLLETADLVSSLKVGSPIYQWHGIFNIWICDTHILILDHA